MNHLGSLPEYSRFKQSGLELRLTSSKTDELGMTHLRYQQIYQKLILQHAELITHVKQGKVYRVDGQLAELDISSTIPEVGAERAIEVAAAFKGLNQPFTSDMRLLIVALNQIYDRLAWEVTIKKGLYRYIFLVDANSGSVLKEIGGIHTTQIK
jgi:Zn-dependent metalloprotease